MDAKHNAANNNNERRHQPREEQSKEKETDILFDSDVDLAVSEDDFDQPSDEEAEEEKIRNASCVGVLVLRLQHAVTALSDKVNHTFRGHFATILFLLLYLAYFGFAMYYRFGDEGSVRLLCFTLLGVVIGTRHMVRHLLDKTPCVRWYRGDKSARAVARIYKIRFFTRWLMYGAMAAFMGYVIVDVAITDAVKLRSLPGMVFFLLICFVFSSHPSKVNWPTIYWSVGLQFLLAVVVMRWEGGKSGVMWVQARLDAFFANSVSASVLLFGESYRDHYMIFGALPILFLSNAVLSMLYYLGAMQLLVKVIGSFLRFVLGTSAIESTGVAASIFLEGPTAMLALRPYLGKLTRSELFTLTTACLASIGGAFLAILAMIGIPVEFMLPAMAISAPATFAVCKLMCPETRKAKKIDIGGELPPDMQYSSILEAAQAGAISVVALLSSVVVSAFALLSLISLTNSTFTWFGDRVGIEYLTMEKILSYICYPLALMMGVELADCRKVAMLMGYRFSSSNFVSLLKLQQLVVNRAQFQKYSLLLPNATVTYVGDHIVLDQWNVTLLDGYVSRRSEAIATYSLCGFSGIMSMLITLGVMITLIPQRRKWLTSMAWPLLVAGNLANFMVGCFAGLLL